MNVMKTEYKIQGTSICLYQKGGKEKLLIAVTPSETQLGLWHWKCADGHSAYANAPDLAMTDAIEALIVGKEPKYYVFPSKLNWDLVYKQALNTIWKKGTLPADLNWTREEYEVQALWRSDNQWHRMPKLHTNIEAARKVIADHLAVAEKHQAVPMETRIVKLTTQCKIVQ